MYPGAPQEQGNAMVNEARSSAPRVDAQQQLPFRPLNAGEHIPSERTATSRPMQALSLDLMEAIRQLTLNTPRWPTLTPAYTEPVLVPAPPRSDAVPTSLRPGHSVRDPRLAAHGASIGFKSRGLLWLALPFQHTA